MQTHWKKYVLKTVEKKDLHEVKTNLRQGGRSWQLSARAEMAKNVFVERVFNSV